MNFVENNKKLLKVSVGILIVCMFPILLNLYLPSSFTAKSITLLILNIFAFIGLVAIAIRVNSRNVRKWEMVLYYLLNIVFVVVIVATSISLSTIAVDVRRHNIPYAPQTDDYLNAYDNIEGDALSITFLAIIFGFISFNIALISGIIGIIKIFVSKNKNKENVSTNIKEIEIDNVEQHKHKAQEIYCSYCGKLLDGDAIFCKYCGKKLNNNKN